MGHIGGFKVSQLILKLFLKNVKKNFSSKNKNSRNIFFFFTLKPRDKAFDAPKNVFKIPKKYNYRTKNNQKIFLRFNAPK
jgi:hypothetical protein